AFRNTSRAAFQVAMRLGLAAFIHESVGGGRPGIMRRGVVAVADRLGNAQDLAKIGAAIRYVGNRPAAELVVQRVLEDRAHEALSRAKLIEPASTRSPRLHWPASSSCKINLSPSIISQQDTQCKAH